MVLEPLLVVGVLTKVGLDLTKDYRCKRRDIKDIKENWEILMDSLGSSVKNNISQRYKMLSVYIKHYGFNAQISLPYGTSTEDLRKLLSKIDVVYKCTSIVEPSKDGNTAYLRVHIIGKGISVKDNAKFKWYSYFQANKFRNNKGETYQLKNGIDIVSPNDKDKILGCKYQVIIPNGLSYEALKNEDLELSNLYGLCQIEIDAKTKKIYCELINEKVSDEEKFVPIKVNPWEVYVGMEYNWNPIILNYQETPSSLISGRIGSGKTVSMIMGILNLVYTCPNDFELYVGMVGEKQDLAIFKNAKQCRYYAQSTNEVTKLIKYLTNEMNRRNKLFSSCNNMCFNIKRYNSIVKEDKKLKYIHFIVDEIADLVESSEIQDLLWNLIRKSRSAGIYLTLASQRFSLANISAEVKANLTCKVCFKMSNTASALTVVSGEGLAQRVVSLESRREFLVDYQDGIKIGKTLQLTEDYMIELMKDHIEDNKIQLDLKGNIIDNEKFIEEFRNEKKIEEEVKEESKTTKKKESRFNIYKNNKSNKKKEQEEKERYLEEKKNEILSNSIKNKK